MPVVNINIPLDFLLANGAERAMRAERSALATFSFEMGTTNSDYAPLLDDHEIHS